MIFKMLKCLTRVGSIILYIPVSFAAGTIWVASCLTIIVVAIPFEYVITGNVNTSNSIADYFIYDVPIMCNKIADDFFKSIKSK